MLWDDRLAEVRAAPGRAGVGVVMGSRAVLTARHVVAGAYSRGGQALARVVRPQLKTAPWVPMTLTWEDVDWDLALLSVDTSAGADEAQWLTPTSADVAIVALDRGAESECLESERARYAVGEVAVPYGTCTEPSDVQAGGGACPVRFRCAGCDHFRTDVSYLPDLTAYLDDLLRARERLAATIDGVDEWARADATPTHEEITRIRRLVNRIKGDIATLSAAERAQVEEAVTVIRKHRAVNLGMPSVPATPSQPREART